VGSDGRRTGRPVPAVPAAAIHPPAHCAPHVATPRGGGDLACPACQPRGHDAAARCHRGVAFKSAGASWYPPLAPAEERLRPRVAPTSPPGCWPPCRGVSWRLNLELGDVALGRLVAGGSLRSRAATGPPRDRRPRVRRRRCADPRPARSPRPSRSPRRRLPDGHMLPPRPARPTRRRRRSPRSPRASTDRPTPGAAEPCGWRRPSCRPPWTAARHPD
jgi:hypothetical protein